MTFDPMSLLGLLERLLGFLGWRPKPKLSVDPVFAYYSVDLSNDERICVMLRGLMRMRNQGSGEVSVFEPRIELLLPKVPEIFDAPSMRLQSSTPGAQFVDTVTLRDGTSCEFSIVAHKFYVGALPSSYLLNRDIPAKFTIKDTYGRTMTIQMDVGPDPQRQVAKLMDRK